MTMNNEDMRTQICRGCMKVGGLLLSMYGDAINDKKLPDKLTSITSITIDSHDGLPGVLCPRCAYRTDAFYNFKLQVEESDDKLRKLFKYPIEDSLKDTLNSELDSQFSKSSCQSIYYDYTDSADDCIVDPLNNVLIDMNYSTHNVNESLNDRIIIGQFNENNSDINKQNDELLLVTSSECDINEESINIVDNEMTNKLNDKIDSSSMDYMLLYVSPDHDKIILKNDDINKESCNTDNNIDKINNDNINCDDNHDNINDINDKCENLNCDSDDYIDPKDNLLGSINDTIVKIKEIKLDNGLIQHQCTLCMENYSELTSVLIHIVDNHIPSTGPFYCVVCEKDCDSYKELRTHVKIHTGTIPYKCFICDKGYSTKRYLKRHMVCHTDFPRYRCSKCGKRFYNKKDLECHISTHINGVPYSCSQCSRVFNHKANYKRHLISHLDPRGVRLPKYPCTICGKRFVNNRTLQTHMRVHTGEKPFKCQICDRSFSQQGNLLNHIRIHSNPRSYTCEVCGKRFNQRATLRDHTLLHTGEKPYVCNVCGIAFTFSAALRRHMWTHAGNKPFGCDICNARFVGRYDLNRHMKIHNNRAKSTCIKNQMKANVICDDDDDDDDDDDSDDADDDDDDDDDNNDNVDINISMETSNHDRGQDNIVVTQVTPVTEQTIFIEHVLVNQDGIQMIVPQEDSVKENVDALLNLIQYD